MGADKSEAYRRAVEQALTIYSPFPEFKAEMPHFIRLFSASIASLPQEHIRSSGYIIDTLEASVWCLLNCGSTKEALLAAVNLGLDTDTTGMVAGGLAGLTYGLADVPRAWLDSLARKGAIDNCVNDFIQAVSSRSSRTLS